MMSRHGFAVALGILGLSLVSQSWADTPTNASQISLSVLSSAPDQISGSDVLLGLEGDPELLQRALGNLEFRVNQHPVQPLRLTQRDGRLEVLIDGLNIGRNQLELHHQRLGQLHELTLTSYPLSGPIFSGPQQFPFVCTVTSELERQPLVDSDQPPGFPVHDDTGALIGYSNDCMIEAYVDWLYRTTEGRYQPLPEDGSYPDDVATTVLTDGREVDFIVRREIGTINRFIYSFATLAHFEDAPSGLSTDLWNGRLLFHFEGGVGVGHSQGRVTRRSLEPEALGLGYAVIYSSGTRTSTHYNLQLGGETALMTKEHFIKRFGVPDYTVAIGGSGGGIQQYIYAQNHPGLIDAGVPQYAYPDMVTQMIHGLDCELLEHFMDVTDKNNRRWRTTANRSLLVGLNAVAHFLDPFALGKLLLGYSSAPGMSECVPGWRGLTPLVLNPHYGRARNQELMQPEKLMSTVRWTHYQDLRNIYGVDEQGEPRTLYDNVGVQYGLRALTDGKITPEEFLRLNALVGGWKRPADMVQEGYPFIGSLPHVLASPSRRFDAWSRRNMTLSPDHITPASRTVGDPEAIRAAYRSGLVFEGQLDIPLIDWRHYLEDVLDMHNSHQSFSARQRIINQMGHADHQLIWFTDTRPTDTSNPLRPRANKEANHTWLALEVLHEWLMNIRANPHLSIAENRPANALDSCFAADGSLIAAGDDVWAGKLDDQPPGACSQVFPTYTTSRMVAGGPIEGGIFKCALKSVDTALNDGTYGHWRPDAYQAARLKEVFPDGVCDYTQPDQGRPHD